MRERAAGYLESAGRRFFRDSNGVIRSRRSLNPRVWQCIGANSEFPLWLNQLLQSSDQRPLYTQNAASSAVRATESARAPVLEFLYPPHTKEFAASRLLRAPKRPVLRRRKGIPDPARYYTSKTPSRRQDADGGNFAPSHSEKEREDDGDDIPIRARETLITLLNQPGSSEYSHAFVLYSRAGHPPDLTSALLAYVCHSDRPSDHTKSIELFDALAESRDAEDYLHMTTSYLNADNIGGMKKMIRQALTSDVGGPSWVFAFSYFLNNAWFSDAQDVWDMRPDFLGEELGQLVLSHLDPLQLPKSILALATFIAAKDVDSSVRQFTSVLLDHAFTSLKILEGTPSETLLIIVRRYRSLGILESSHYFKLIRCLAWSPARATFIKSMVVYRNFRWQINTEPPPADLLFGLLAGLRQFGITKGIRYLLDETIYFHGKPSKTAYALALNAFAKTGDAQQVNEIFDMLVRHHGKNLYLQMLTPLLHVHARVGNVRETLIQFKRLKEEFNVEPNTVCWNILLTAHAKNHDLKRAFTTYDEMLKNGIEPNSSTFGTLMGLCANKGDIDNVLHLLAELKTRKVEVTTPTLDPIVEAYCNNQLIDMAEQVAEACVDLNAKGDLVRMWNLLLWNYAFRIDLESVSRIRSRMEAIGIQPDGMTYAGLMLSLVLMGQTDSARRILRTLHRSRRVHAAEFHYAIILYGYVRTRNRDMVHVVFREIRERFGRPGLSSRLLMLRSQLQRDLENVQSSVQPGKRATQRLERSEKLLLDTIRASNIKMLAIKDPAPGTSKESLRQALPSQYYGPLIKAYGKTGAFDRAEELLDEYTKAERRLHGDTKTNSLPPLRLLTDLMDSHLMARQFEKVEECWTRMYLGVLRVARRFDVSDFLAGRPPGAEAGETLPPPLPEASRGGHTLLVSAEPSKATDAANTVSVLPSYRTTLSRPLNLYLRSLAWRGDTWKIYEVVPELEKAGFTLTAFNWSTYVRLLSSSDRQSDQVQAFAAFEEKFMPNFPGWDNIRRGRAVKPPGAPAFTSVIEKRKTPETLFGEIGRRLWTKLHPDFMPPSYVTMVHLAAVLNGFRERSINVGNAELRELYRIAPKTIDALGSMPVLREKYQGVLLRGRQVQGDRPSDKGPAQPFVWTGGLLGVGGRTRTDATVREHLDEPITDDPSEEQQISSKQVAGTPGHDGDPEHIPDEIPAPPEKLIEPQDAYDVEAETRLQAQQRAAVTSDEILDVEPPKMPDDPPPMEEHWPSSFYDAQESEYPEHPEQHGPANEEDWPEENHEDKED